VLFRVAPCNFQLVRSSVAARQSPLTPGRRRMRLVSRLDHQVAAAPSRKRRSPSLPSPPAVPMQPLGGQRRDRAPLSIGAARQATARAGTRFPRSATYPPALLLLLRRVSRKDAALY